MRRDTAWYKAMKRKYGNDEIISEIMQANSNKSSRNSDGRGGFRDMAQNDPDKFRQLSSRAGKIGGRISRRGEKHDS